MRHGVRSSVAVVVVMAVAQPLSARADADGEGRRAPPRRELTLSGAIEIALSGNPQLAIEAENVVAAEARTRSDAALRLPVLGIRGNAQFWDRAIVTGPEFGNVTIRDQVTGTVDFSVSQPLSGALVIEFESETFALTDGDSLYFPSTRPHRIRNSSDGPTTAIWIITPPSF